MWIKFTADGIDRLINLDHVESISVGGDSGGSNVYISTSGWSHRLLCWDADLAKEVYHKICEAIHGRAAITDIGYHAIECCYVVKIPPALKVTGEDFY